ncbi:MAG TPA: sigma-70 family RNA polymerase sigma factor [Polyangiaceae bacterium]|jgi:RNA polymerase sigma-70 factor (ECF subfamily)|nr:sigma-70 family RNA polymerase sigma factor [Polyangiaceae bacterium]
MHTVVESVASPSLNVPCELSPERLAEVALRDGLLRGDAAAWRAFTQQHGRLVCATVARIVRRFGLIATSEDVREIEASFAVELLANDKAKLRAFQPERGVRFSTWIAMLASHTAYDFLRKRRREPRADAECDAEMVASESPDPYSVCELMERGRLIESLARDLTEKDREFLELYYAEGLDPTEVAERMGISVKTVYSKKHKIQGRLEALLCRRNLAA